MSIAYYIKDSIPGNFTYYKEMQADLDARAKEFEAKMIAIQQEGQRMMANYQRKMQAGLLSANAAAVEEQKIAKKQEQMQVLEQTDGAAIQQDSYERNLELIEKMEKYGKEYAGTHGYSIFFGRESAGQILYIDSTMNVTMDFIEYMNKREAEAAEDSTEEGTEQAEQ